MYRATTTLALLIAALALWASPQAGRQTARIAAQDAPTATIAAAAEATATPPPPATATATPEPTLPVEPTLTATATPEPPTPTATPTEEPSPTATSTATQTPEPADPTPTAQLVSSPMAVSGASEEPLSLFIATAEVGFGRVTARGELDPVIAGLSSTSDDRGAFYILAGAVAATVTSGVPWSGACAAAENAGTATTVAVATGRLEWRLAGTATWTPFSPSGADPGCFPRPEPGTTTFVYDLRLRVEADDPPGTFRTVLVFTVEP